MTHILGEFIEGVDICIWYAFFVLQKNPLFWMICSIFGPLSGRSSIYFIGTLGGRKGMDVWPVQRPLDQDWVWNFLIENRQEMLHGSLTLLPREMKSQLNSRAGREL